MNPPRKFLTPLLLLKNARGVDFLCTYALARSSTSIGKTSTPLMKFDKYSPGSKTSPSRSRPSPRPCPHSRPMRRRDCNSGLLFPIPEFAVEDFVIPGSQDPAGIMGSRREYGIYRYKSNAGARLAYSRLPIAGYIGMQDNLLLSSCRPMHNEKEWQKYV